MQVKCISEIEDSLTVENVLQYSDESNWDAQWSNWIISQLFNEEIRKHIFYILTTKLENV